MAISIEHDEFTLGYVVCSTCEEPKGIRQGKGKRSKFVHGRCVCGPDTRTGKKAQIELSAFKSLEVIKAAIAAKLLNPSEPNKPNNEEYEPNTDLINAQSLNHLKPNTSLMDLVRKPNTVLIDLDSDTKPEPNTNALGLVTETKQQTKANALGNHSIPNSDMQSNQIIKPNNEQSADDEMSLPKCIGVGSVVGLAFGLLFNALS